MRKKAIPALMLACLVLPSCGPKLREAAKVKPKKMGAECRIQQNVELSAEQALCVAGLAGLDVGSSSLRDARTASGVATWVIDETCGSANPKCIGIVVRKSDGAILDTRYLYVKRAYESASGQ